jgi:hypothetical protein
MNEVSKLPKSIRILLLIVLIAGIAMPAILLYQIRSRLDLSVWLWGMVLIAGIFAISIPILFWQEKRKKRPLSFPWPVVAANPYFGKGSPREDISLKGTLTWTPEIFRRMVKSIVRYTPAGKSHRRTIFILAAIGGAGMILGTVFVCLHELSGLALVAASALLLAHTESLRARVPAEIRAGTQVRWALSKGNFTMSPVDLKAIPREGQSTLVRPRGIHLSSAKAIVQTPAGFIIWPHDFIEFWLPMEAFTTAKEVEIFQEIARSCVANYVYESDGRR